MQRFYLEELNTINYNFVLTDKEIFNQLIKVLRIKIWDEIIFFDWKDNYDYIFEIKDIWKKDIKLQQINRIQKFSEIDFELNLFQAIPNKLDKIEEIIKNGTQIWITNFLFFKAERSQKLILTDKKIERLNKIILEASEQCGRNVIPNLIIWEKIHFEKLEWKNIFLHTKNENSKKINEIDFKKNEKIINLFVWPEGWFSDDEVWRFERNNFDRLFLWDRILRTELAWVSCAFYIIQNSL